MKKENFVDDYKTIGEFVNLLTEAGELYDKLPVDIQQEILRYHNEPVMIWHCIQWGILAAKELHEDWRTIALGHDTESNKRESDAEMVTIHISNPLLLDRLRTLAVEYSASIDLLLNLAAKRLVDDVDLLRNLRTGKIEMK